METKTQHSLTIYQPCRMIAHVHGVMIFTVSAPSISRMKAEWWDWFLKLFSYYRDAWCYRWFAPGQEWLCALWRLLIFFGKCNSAPSSHQYIKCQNRPRRTPPVEGVHGASRQSSRLSICLGPVTCSSSHAMPCVHSPNSKHTLSPLVCTPAQSMWCMKSGDFPKVTTCIIRRHAVSSLNTSTSMATLMIFQMPFFQRLPSCSHALTHERLVKKDKTCSTQMITSGLSRTRARTHELAA
jgi:hypothetical protein